MSSGCCGIFFKKLKIMLESNIGNRDLDDIKFFFYKILFFNKNI